MGYFAYLRCSTDEQTDSKHGLNAQLDSIHGFVSRNKSDLLHVFRDEGVSGATPLQKRPGLFQAITLLQKSDVLLVAKRDRLGRDPLVIAMIEASVSRKGAKIISVAGEGTDSDEPTQILMRRMVDAFGEYERLIIKARTKAALQAKKTRNELIGSVPFGYDLLADKKTLLPNKAEQETLVQIRKWRRQGQSFNRIAQKLNRAGCPSKHGKSWYAKTVLNLCKNEERKGGRETVDP